MNNFLKEFKDRGYFYQCTVEIGLSKLLNEKSNNVYIGFDSTAPSLHVGSLLQIMCLDYYKNMDTDQLFFWAEEQLELETHQVKKRQGKFFRKTNRK